MNISFYRFVEPDDDVNVNPRMKRRNCTNKLSSSRECSHQSTGGNVKGRDEMSAFERVDMYLGDGRRKRGREKENVIYVSLIQSEQEKGKKRKRNLLIFQLHSCIQL